MICSDGFLQEGGGANRLQAQVTVVSAAVRALWCFPLVQLGAAAAVQGEATPSVEFTACAARFAHRQLFPSDMNFDKWNFLREDFGG